MLNNLSRLKILIIIFVLVFIDQISKNAALAFLAMPRRINDFLSLEIYRNHGIAFGLPISADMFYLAVFIFLALIFFSLKKRIWGNWREMDREKIFTIILIVSGVLGNMIDRVRWGYIIDYINIGGMLVFNLADVMIAIGAVMLLKDLFFKKRKIDGRTLI